MIIQWLAFYVNLLTRSSRELLPFELLYNISNRHTDIFVLSQNIKYLQNAKAKSWWTKAIWFIFRSFIILYSYLLHSPRTGGVHEDQHDWFLSSPCLFSASSVIFSSASLLPCTNSPLNVLLSSFYSRGSRNYHWASGDCSILSEIGTLHMEFAYLSEVTGKSVYKEKVEGVRKRLADATKPMGLYPNYMNPRSGSWCQHHSSLAGLGDSFYEYLLKEWLRSNGKDVQARQMYDEAMKGVERHMLKRSNGGHYYLGDYKFGRVEPKMDHLACFAGECCLFWSNLQRLRYLLPSIMFIWSWSANETKR